MSRIDNYERDRQVVALSETLEQTRLSRPRYSGSICMPSYLYLGAKKTSTQEIQTWIAKYLSNILGLPVSSIDVDASFERMGMDSVSAVGMVGDLEAWLEIEIEPTLSYDFRSAATFSQELSRQRQTAYAQPVTA